MKPVILIVDDDPLICGLLHDVFNEHVFTVRICHNGQEALLLAAQEPEIALVLLDMMLPDISGLLVLQNLRKVRPELPIIILTGLASEPDMVTGLEMGSDDYITKPFNPRVVVARVKAVLRRSAERVCDGPFSSTANIMFNGWHLYTERCELRDARNAMIPLTQGEYTLLLALVQNARRVLSREQLLELTHNENIEVFDRTIDVLIMRLRRKIEVNPHQPVLIKTIRGIGYVFTAGVIYHDNTK